MTTDFCDQRYHRPMPDTPRNGPAPEPSQPGPSAAPIAAPPWPPPPLTAVPKTNRWLPFATLAIALVGLAVGIGAWLRPLPAGSPAAPEPTYTDEQIAAAKANVCEAFGLVKEGVVINTHRTNPVPDDAIGALATGVYGDVVLYQGGDYLLDHLAKEPATSGKLANLIRSLGSTMKKLAMIDLAGEPDLVRDPVYRAVNDGITTADEMCE